MVALRMRVFLSVLNNVLPSKRVCCKKEPVDSNILQSISYKVLRTVCLVSLNIGHCRRKWEVVQYSDNT